MEAEIIDQITDVNLWYEYLEFKKEQKSCLDKEIKELENYLENKQFIKIAEEIKNEKYLFTIPQKNLINKIDKSKKRVVYSYNYDEMMILKVITYAFSKKYDNKYSPNCYSFRKKYGVKNAIERLTKNKELNKLYGYKVDISNYFNSADTQKILFKFKKFAPNETKLLKLLQTILLNKKVRFKGQIIEEEKGMMAGLPISSFLANIYLFEVDEFFKNKNIEYIRYSDDIILFTKEEQIVDIRLELNSLIEKNNLKINSDKVKNINPGEQIDFLGFKIDNGIIDISEISKQKIKGKIKRNSRKLRRWMLNKNTDYTRAVAAVIRKFNRKFYMFDNTRELTWALWYFPIINTDKSLKEIDQYFQNTLRYIKTGKYTKKNYNLKYKELKKLGYRSLVNEFWKYKNYENI